MRMRKKKHATERLQACSDLFLYPLNPCDSLQETLVPERAVQEQIFDKLIGRRQTFLEIGCGKGRFVCEMAQRYPDRFYLAVEKVPDVLVMAMERARDAGLHNIRFLPVDAASLADWLPAQSIDGIYLNFSDPWPKKKHAKRRLTAPAFLQLYRTRLKQGGMIFMKTDNRPLFDDSIESFRQNGYTLSELTYDLHRSEYAGTNIMTEYEEAFSQKGVAICRLAACPTGQEACPALPENGESV